MLLDVVTNVSLTHALAVGSLSMLDTNDIQHVPKGAFDGLPGLVTLYVTLTPDYTSHKVFVRVTYEKRLFVMQASAPQPD